MGNFRRSLLVGAFLVCAVPAGATPLTVGQALSFAYDGATSSPVCAKCDATSTFTYLSGNQIRVNLSNTSSDGTVPAKQNVLTAAGFLTDPVLNLTGASFAFGGSMATGWEVTNNGGGMGGFNLIPGGKTGNDYLDAGQSGVVTITFAAALPTTLNLNGTAVHFQALEGSGDSTKPAGTITTVAAVPEPASLILLGSGLFGIGAAARKRARLSRRSV